MKIVRATGQYEMFTAQAGSPACGMSAVMRLSDHLVSDWFDKETAEKLLNLNEEMFDNECSELTF